MTDAHLGITTENYVTTVTINRPEKRNALTYALLRDLQALMPQLANDPQTRVCPAMRRHRWITSRGVATIRRRATAGDARPDGTGDGQRRRP